jgi:hypothetical protein
MSIENIGIGKLPNAYVSKINIETDTTKTISVTTDLKVIDESMNGDYVWSSDEFMKPFLKVCLIKTKDPSIISALNQGFLNPYPYSFRPNMERTIIETYPIKEFIEIKSEGRTVYYKKDFQIFDKDISTLSYYCFCFVDHLELSTYLGIKLTGDLKEYTGPIASETIFESSVIPKTSYVFKTAANNVWSGPVFQTNGKYYGGSYLNPNLEQPILTRMIVKNNKITDNRAKTFSNRELIDPNLNTVIGEALYSLNEEAHLTGIFSINLAQILLTKTKIGKKLFQVNQGLFNNALNFIFLNSIQIRRRQIRETKRLNTLGTPKIGKMDVFPYSIIASSQESSPRAFKSIESLKEINIFNDPEIRTFEFLDDSKNEKTKGNFIYEVHLTVVDNTKLMITQMISGLKSNLNSLEQLTTLVQKPINFDMKTKMLKETFIFPSSIDGIIEEYYKHFSLLKKVTNEELNELIRNRKTLFRTQTYQKNFGLNLIKDYNALIALFNKTFDIKETISSHRISFGSPNIPGLLSFSKTFEEVIDFSSIASSYDLMGIKTNKQALRITTKDFIQRTELEVDRFFDKSQSMISDDLNKMSAEDRKNLTDLEASKLSFLSPISFRSMNKQNNLKDLSNIDLDLVSKGFTKHIKSKTEKKKTSKKEGKARTKVSGNKNSKPKIDKRNGRFKFDFKKPIFKINNLKGLEFLEIEKYLGPTSEMVNIGNNLDREILAEDSEKIQTKIEIANEIKTKRTKSDFDLSEKNNIFQKFKNSKNYDPNKIKKLPVSMKSILNSRSSAAKNEILDSDSDIIKNPESKVATEMIFNSNQKLQALSGYKKDKFGNKILTEPIWIDITKEMLEQGNTFLCRTIYLDMPEVGLVVDKSFKLKVQNSIFIINEGTSLLSVQQTELNVLQQETMLEEQNVIYTTNNIIKQPIVIKKGNR